MRLDAVQPVLQSSCQSVKAPKPRPCFGVVFIPDALGEKMRYGPWTLEEDQLLVSLRASGRKWQVIAKALGRTEAATIGRLGTLRKRFSSSAAIRKKGSKPPRNRQPQPLSRGDEL